MAADERDQRDMLLGELAEKISFNTIEMPDGTINVTLSNGFTLVNGATSRSIEISESPSFAQGANSLPRSLDGGLLGAIVYDTNPGTGRADIDLTKVLQAGGGTIGGYLKARGYGDVSSDPADTDAFKSNGTIPEVASRVEAIARSLLTDFNKVYLGYTVGGVNKGPSGDLDGRIPQTTANGDPAQTDAVFALFDFNYNGAVAKDDDGDGLPTGTDLQNILDNDSTLTNFSSRLKVNDYVNENPRHLAAALDSDPAAATYSFSPGDGRNMEELAKLQKAALIIGVGNFNTATTINEAYNQTVGHVGNLKAASTIAAKVATDNFTTASDRRDQVSAVSLDEEFTKLISFQKAYQASARMIKIADDLLQQVVQLI